MAYTLTACFDKNSFDEIQDAQDLYKTLADGRFVGVKDASESLTFARQLEHIKSRMYEVKYAELKGRGLVPFSNEAGPDAVYLTYRVWNGTAIAKVVTNYSTDYEMVTAFAEEKTIQFFDVGNAFGYSYRDLRQASKAGVSLDSKLAEQARKGHELAIDDAVAVGVSVKKTYGLVNNPNCSLVSLTNGTWSSATGAQILADLNQLVTTMFTGTLELLQGDTMLVSTACYRLISTKLFDTANASNVTVLEMFQKQNPGITVTSWTRLNTANAAGTNGRIVFYKKSPEVMEFEMAEEFTIGPAYQELMGVKFPCTSRFAGLQVHLPAGVLYADNQTL